MGQTVYCSAAPMLQARYPERVDTEDSRRGDALHWLAADSWIHDYDPGHLVGSEAENGVLITQDMCDEVELYHLDIAEACDNDKDVNAVLIERKVTVPRVHPECWGTFDAGLVSYDRRRITIWDLKGGLMPVRAFENWQEITYGLGWLSELGFDDRTVEFDFRIVQPRHHRESEKIQSWVVPAAALRDHAKRLEWAALKAMSINPEMASGPHCHYCSASHRCPAAQTAALNGVDVAFNFTEIVDPTPAEISSEMQTLEAAARAIEYRLDAVRDDIEYQISTGVRIPSYTATQKLKNRSWKDEGNVKLKAKAKGIELLAPPKLLSPAKAEKAGVLQKFVDDNTEQLPGKMKVKYDDNSLTREALFNATDHINNGPISQREALGR
jgi:hypothetical protein